MKEEPGTVREPAFGNYFVSAYPPFSCWNEAGLEPFRKMLRRPAAVAGREPLGLYVHVPFCARRCDYCYYLSYAGRTEEMDRYLSTLTRELRLYRASPAFEGAEPSFVYFGGGTPSLLSEPQLHKLLEELQGIAPWTAVREATFECAPRSVTVEKLRLLREAGITRLSLGVQQLDDEVLRRNGRVHLVRDVHRAYGMIRAAGFDVVNLDLIVGLDGETTTSFLKSLDAVIEMAPDSVTIYQLEIPHNTPLYSAMRESPAGPKPATWEAKHARLARAFARLREAGYTVRSAYAAVRAPERCRFVYQEEQYRGANLLGIGASSFSYLAGIHQQNHASLTTYVDAVDGGELPLSRAYVLNEDERIVREFALQLKLGRVEAEAFRCRYGVEVEERFAEPLARFEREGWLVVEDDGVTLTGEGLPRADRMILSLYLPEHRVSRYS